MKAWKKGAIIGGLWGFVSILQRNWNPGSPVFYSTFEKIIFFPYWLEMTVIYSTPLGVINYIPPIAIIFIVIEGALIGGILGYIIKNVW